MDLQNLLTCLAFQLIANGRLVHHHIPDNPEVESERRQVFFAAAIGLPTFYVRKNTENLMLRSLLKKVPEVRHSRRYPGFLRVKLEALPQDAGAMGDGGGCETYSNPRD